MESYIEYLQIVKEKTTEIRRMSVPRPNICCSSDWPTHADTLCYTEYKISKSEFKKILKLIEYNDLILYPISGLFGFHPAYQIYEIDPLVPTNDIGSKLLCQFDERQLPDKVNLSSLEHIIYSKENLSKIKKCKLKKPESISYYYY